MKCPFCKHGEIVPTKNGYYSCGCGMVFIEAVNEDPELNCKYIIEFMRSKKIEPPEVFEVAKNKYNSDKYTVVGIKPDRGNYSLLFGQQYIVLKRKNK